MSLYGQWKDCIITIATSTTVSAEVSLGELEGGYDLLQVYCPALTSCSLSLQVAEETGGTFAALAGGLGRFVSTGARFEVLRLGGFRYIKVVTSVAQAANRTFRVRGIKI